MTAAGDQRPSEFLRRSLWRIRTAPERRLTAAGVTFIIILGAGVALIWATFAALDWLGAPGWVAALFWLAPTIGALVWALGRPTPAILSDDDDDSWVGYSIRLAMIGSEQPRPRPVRAILAVVFGAPVVSALTLFLLFELTGLV